ncbi:hypothetical protein BCV73_28190 [Paenibacillus sp. SSG-1]|nr:hypothetical protein BCV73_28190 [Paenibacillus sp. SSG-1]
MLKLASGTGHYFYDDMIARPVADRMKEHKVNVKVKRVILLAGVNDNTVTPVVNKSAELFFIIGKW